MLAAVAPAIALAAPAAASAASAPSGLPADFSAASARSGVPVDLLEAMAWVNTHWRTPAGPSLDGGWGLMHVGSTTAPGSLRRAARAAGVSQAAVRRSPRANLQAGAALVRAAAGSGRPPRTLAAWYRAVARAGGGTGYADQVYATLRRGVRARSGGEVVVLRAHPEAGAAIPLRPLASAVADVPGAVWTPASPRNFTAAWRPATYPITRIVIHVTDGSYSSAINWFANPSAQASAHYVIRSSDGAITQMVRNRDVAWHAGNWPYNTTSIGIEHEAITGDCSWYTSAMYRSSARLVATLAGRYGIPVDRAHIIGHSEVPDPNHRGQFGGIDHHTDPGRCWNWSLYLGMVRADLGVAQPSASTPEPTAAPPGPAGFSQVVDDANRSRFRASRAWKVRRGVHTAPARTVSDAARFRLSIPATGRYTVYARWPGGRGWSGSVPVGVTTTSGVRWIRVNQRAHGRRWVRLGTFALPAGNGWDVAVSRWTGARGAIAADAVRVVAAR